MIKRNKSEDFPLTAIDTVWHVGDLRQLRQKRTGMCGSHEGPGIAVSECPEDWEKIAALPGSHWQLSRIDGEDGLVVDFHELTQTQRDDYVAIAVRKRLIRACKKWRAFMGHDEDGESWFEFGSRKEAELELSGDDDDIIEEFDAYEAMPGLDTWWQQYFTRSLAKCRPATNHDELATLKLMMDEGSYDGVWWYDDYSPLRLSAPRGVIFPTRINDWKRQCVDDIRDSDDYRLPPISYA